MFDSPLPRAGKEKRSELPYRNLGPGNYTPQFPNDLVSDLDFIKYRKTDASAPQDITRLQNYANYQSVCLAQNLDDIAQDVIKTKTHLNGLHAELDHMENNQGAILMKLDQLITKMETLENAVQELQASLKQEQETASPVLVPDPSNDASFSFLGTSTSSDEPMKFLTLKQLAISLPNPTLARISEVAQLASDKLLLVQSQITELETEILASRTDQLAIVHSPNPTIKALGGDSQPESKPASDIPESSKKRNPFSAWEAWINARYTSNKKAPMDVDGEPKVSLKNTESSPISDLDCKSKADIEKLILTWQQQAMPGLLSLEKDLRATEISSKEQGLSRE
jgi:hypothetical protein